MSHTLKPSGINTAPNMKRKKKSWRQTSKINVNKDKFYLS